MNNNPLVTIIASCYNQERFLLDSLESIKNQTYTNTQLIIWDDFSTDNSIQLIKQWIRKNDIECTFLIHEQNMGICKSLNHALGFAKGKYLQMIALDDIILPDKIEKQVTLLESQEDFSLVFSDVYLISEKGEMLADTFHGRSNYFFKRHSNYFEALMYGNFIQPVSALYKLESIKNSGFYDENLYAEDWDMHIKLALKNRFLYQESYFSAKYRIVSTSANHDPAKRSIALNSTCESLKKYIGYGSKSDQIIYRSMYSFAKEMKRLDIDLWAKWAKYLVQNDLNFKTLKLYSMCRVVKLFSK